MAFLLLMLCACMCNVVYAQKRNGEAKKEIDLGENTKRLYDMSTKLNLFNFEVQRRLSKTMGDPQSNIVISPLSLFIAFSAICYGAKGETRNQMVRALNCGKDETYMLQWYRPISANDADLHIANSIWVGDKNLLKADYEKAMTDYFNMKIRKINFNDPDGSASRINRWVADNTRQHIVDLIPPGSIDERTRLLLVNAVYFKAKWLNPFDKSKTIQNKFLLLSSKYAPSPHGSTHVKVSYMTKQDYFPIAYNEDATLLEMPYDGGMFTMLFVLPRNLSHTNTLANKITSQFLSDLRAKVSNRQKIFVQIPKFEVIQKVNLDGYLLNMGDLFDEGKANLSGINDKERLYVSKAFHQAKVTVDEEGTVASAATGVVTSSRSRPPEFILNRPFRFYIIHKPTEAIIFSGEIKNPQNE